MGAPAWYSGPPQAPGIGPSYEKWPVVFYLGTHQPHWLWHEAAGFPLFVSHRTLAKYKTLHRATHGWALDSGGFSEVSQFGEWRTSPREYVAAVARYDSEIGHLDWAAPQDWMCEPDVIHGGGPGHLAGTGLSVAEHQARTVANFLELSELWPAYSNAECPFMPVLQGWTSGDYWRCAELYDRAGVRLEDYPVVGLGSVCRRQASTAIAQLVGELTPWIAVHGFGMKKAGLISAGHRLTSADSMAWSFDARRHQIRLPGHPHRNCANCLPYATQWRQRLLADLQAADRRGRQDDLFAGQVA
jgi:hypothetical protein